LCVVVVAIAMMLLSRIGLIERAEHWTADFRTALLSERKSTQHEAVALVLISEETLEDYSVRVPLDRTLVARLVRAIASARPAAIGLDIVFTRPTNPTADADLMDAVRGAEVPLVLGVVDHRAGLPAKQLAFHRMFVAEADRLVGHVFFERETNKYGISERVVRQMAGPILERWVRPLSRKHSRASR
jgi:CHASE2 domain-containing sensor protein